jgi:hypothetical protein
MARKVENGGLTRKEKLTNLPNYDFEKRHIDEML